MNADDQGVRERGRQRYQAVPRSLVFLTSANPESGEREVLLLKGAHDKRLWAGRYNGLGGHIEPDEDIHAAAVREVEEETGLRVGALTLRAVVNIDTGADADGRRVGVLMFVFVGEAASRVCRATTEGRPEWVSPGALPSLPLVDDLYELLPRVLGPGAFVFGHYSPAPDGRLTYHFDTR